MSDLLDRCQPRTGAANAIPYGLATSAICTTVDIGRLQEGFRSFPSGHASSKSEVTRQEDEANRLLSAAWAGLGFFGLYLAGKLHLFDQRGHTIKAWIAVVPFFGAALIAVTRVMDYRHHPTESVTRSSFVALADFALVTFSIIAGSLLGMIIAHFSYRLYYPSLADTLAHRPYAPRIAEDREDEIDERDDEAFMGEPYTDNRIGPEGTVRRPGGKGQDSSAALPLHGQNTDRLRYTGNSSSHL